MQGFYESSHNLTKADKVRSKLSHILQLIFLTTILYIAFENSNAFCFQETFKNPNYLTFHRMISFSKETMDFLCKHKYVIGQKVEQHTLKPKICS